MAAMSLLGFMLPPDSGEKVSLEMTVLLSLSVFMLMVSEIMPPTSETFPFIGNHYEFKLLHYQYMKYYFSAEFDISICCLILSLYLIN